MICLKLLLSVLSASVAGYIKFLRHRWLNLRNIIHQCLHVQVHVYVLRVNELFGPVKPYDNDFAILTLIKEHAL